MKVILWGCALLAPMFSVAAVPASGSFDCLIEPAQVVELRSTVEGLIEKVNVRRGDSVRRGQVLAELESRAERLTVESVRFRSQMEGQIATAESRIKYATRKFDRSDEMEKQKMVTAQARDEAEAELRLAQAELKAAQENRELARIEHRRAELLALEVLRALDAALLQADNGEGRRVVHHHHRLHRQVARLVAEFDQRVDVREADVIGARSDAVDAFHGARAGVDEIGRAHV